MTEQEWLTCADPTPMLVFLRWTSVPTLRSRTSDRKMLLFACACCSEIEESVTDERSKEALSTAWRFADGNATIRELNGARTAAWRAVHDLQRSTRQADRSRKSAACAAAYAAAYPATRYAIDAAANAAHATASAAVDAAYRDAINAVAGASEELSRYVKALADSAKQSQVALLRDIIGNPFQHVTIDPAWLTPNLVLLAQNIYTDQAFSNLPAFGDALSVAGCDSEGILSHCYSEGPHVRGCWVLDSILGKA